MDRTYNEYARIMAAKLVDFELTSDLVFKNNGQSYGDAVALTYDKALARWTANTSSSVPTFKVFDPANEKFAARGERGCCAFRDGRFVLVAMYSSVQWFAVKGSSPGLNVPGYSIAEVSSGTTILGKAVQYVSIPDATFHRHYAIIGPDGVPAGKCGVATWRGPAKVSVLTGSPQFGQGWGPQPNAWNAKRGSLGLSPMENTTSGNTLFLGEYPLTMAKGKTTGAINKGASGGVDVWTGTLGAETASGMTITSAYNAYANVGSGKWVTVAWQNDGWQLIAAEC